MSDINQNAGNCKGFISIYMPLVGVIVFNNKFGLHYRSLAAILVYLETMTQSSAADTLICVNS